MSLHAGGCVCVWGGYENELVIEEHCTTSSAPHDLTLSLLRLVLLPGYYFLWQHLSWWGEQHWKDSDNCRLCILWTGSPYMSTEKLTTAQRKMHPKQSSVCFASVKQKDSQCNSVLARDHFSWTYASLLKEKKPNRNSIKEIGHSIIPICALFAKKHPCQVFRFFLLS